MGKTRSLAQSVLNAADFPGEILTGVPVVEIKGGAEAVILGHRGVMAYDGNRIRIATALGPVLVTGDGLRIFRMNRERIVVQGSVRRVELEEAPC
ncbi:MAG: YabP/YqfC family sporulation protein [Oscillospiraceae bacterium]|nr:YabP/YqfC family sporulation protein [Oscillospiraceae bacterium]